MDFNPKISTITLNAIGLNTPVKLEIFKLDKKAKTQLYVVLPKTHLKNIGRLKIKV